MALVVGNMIGVGIFVLPASLAPYGLNALLAWAVVCVGTLALAGTFAGLAHLLPRADGPYGYIRQTLGEIPASLALWAYWVSVWLSNATIATGVAGYFVIAFPSAAVLRPDVLAIAFVWAMVLVNAYSLRSGGGAQIVSTAIKLIPMLAIVALGVWVLATTPGRYVAQLPTTPLSPGGVMMASTIALYPMLGIESASVPAARVQRPHWTIPRATLIGTAFTALIYVTVFTVPLLLVPQTQLAGAVAPFALLTQQLVGGASGRWLALFVVISGLGCLNGWTLLVGQLSRTLAQNGLLPAAMGDSNRRGAPVLALVVTGALASTMVWMSYSDSLVAMFTFLMRAVTAANLPMYFGCTMALLIAWRRMQATRWLLAAALPAAGYVLFALLGLGGEPALLVLVLLLAGVPLYLLAHRPGRQVRSAHPTGGEARGR